MTNCKKEVKCLLVDPPDDNPLRAEKLAQKFTPCRKEDEQSATEIHEAYPPLGVLYIAATLRKESIDVDVIEARTSGLSHEQVLSTIPKEVPDFVEITVAIGEAYWGAWARRT